MGEEKGGARSQTASYEDAMAVGRAHLIAGRPAEASAAFIEATKHAPGSAAAWRALGDARRAAGDKAGGGAAHLRALQASAGDPQLIAAAKALAENRLAHAYPLLAARLKAEPTNLAALRLMADLAALMGRSIDAARMLGRALDLAPGFDAARTRLADMLYEAKPEEALAEIDGQLARRPGHAGYRILKAAVLDRAGEYEAAIAVYRAILADDPGDAAVWRMLGHVLKTIGEIPECIAAYHRSIALLPAAGESYWALANLKTYRFSAGEIEAMRALLARADIAAGDRVHLEFALGRALEEEGDPALSFAYYAEGNRLRRGSAHHDPARLANQCERARRLFTPAFLDARAGSGCAAPDPVFIVGMPRSGSTLVEQILASHPRIEGTMELDELLLIVRKLDGAAMRGQDGRYPEILASLDARQLAALGEDYIARTRARRKTDRPRFIDKLPANFAFVGLIRLILPNAAIIDVRRHPLACCVSNFTQHFARGHGFSYGLEEVGTYYADYVRMMALWAAVLPGKVHRIGYERLVTDTESEVRRLLAYLGLPFDPACLRFHESRRAVRTPSAEQVRQPMHGGGLDRWRRYEPWLDPLKNALGEVLDCYPEVPGSIRSWVATGEKPAM